MSMSRLEQDQRALAALNPRNHDFCQPPRFGGCQHGSDACPARRRWHVTPTSGVLYSQPRRAAKRRRCSGHLAPEPHWIEVGDEIVWSALPPGDPEINNDGWWHAAYCVDCAPRATR